MDESPPDDERARPRPSAAEEPRPYDPRAYQNPHPLDRQGPAAVATKKSRPAPGEKQRAAAEVEDAGCEQNKQGSLLCGNCGLPNPKSRCKQCGTEVYCDRKCQLEHWKYGGHKKACKAFVVAAATQAQHDRLVKAALEADKVRALLDTLAEKWFRFASFHSCSRPLSTPSSA